MKKLTRQQKSIFNEFTTALYENFEKEEIYITYRGNKKSDVKNVTFRGVLYSNRKL